MFKLLIFIFLIIFSAPLFAGKQKYEANWHTEFHRGISQALIKGQVRGCGEYKYKENARHRSEFLVRCTLDGKNWTAYLVWPKINKIMGPYKTDPGQN